tara:strand:+ start:125 stop:463 length:339 start_codon:yes stop_codon:yes gene_type:complete
MDGGDLAILGGGGTAALGFVLGVVQRYVGPRLNAVRERLEKAEENLARIDEKHDALLDRMKAGLLEQREITGVKVTEVHLKMDKELGDVRAELAKVRETVGYLRGKTTTSGN